MGESRRANMMGQRVFIIALMASSLCVALPTTDLVVPEAKDSGTTGAEFVQSTLKSGGTETQCRTFATETISSINAGVTSEQGVLAAIDTGAGCAQEGQSGVATATTNKANADAVVVTKTQAVTDATATQATACNAPVAMVVNLPTLAASTCYDYTQEADFLSVQAACDAANTALSQANSGLSAAQTAATDAQTSLDAAVAEAARLMSECHCRVQQEQAAAWTAAGTATASHAADWKQAHEVLCALDQTSTCTVPTCPAVTQPTLAAGVADEDCTVAESAFDLGTEAWPAGYCLSNGRDQNSGVTKLDGSNYEGNTKEAQCLAQGNAGCYVHTEHVNFANSVARHKCLLRDVYDTRATQGPLKNLVNFGGNGQANMQTCEGDCDSDSDCAGSLQCFQRDSREAVPGRANNADVPHNYDFCYDPNH